jgi:predicted  nucleic acid-binding Zn-ribbon protein
MTSLSYQFAPKDSVSLNCHTSLGFRVHENRERVTLMNKITNLSGKIKGLREKNEQMEETVADLRALLTLAGEESYREEKEISELTSNLTIKREIMQSKLARINESGRHLYQCSLFWG